MVLKGHIKIVDRTEKQVVATVPPNYQRREGSSFMDEFPSLSIDICRSSGGLVFSRDSEVFLIGNYRSYIHSSNQNNMIATVELDIETYDVAIISDRVFLGLAKTSYKVSTFGILYIKPWTTIDEFQIPLLHYMTPFWTHVSL